MSQLRIPAATYRLQFNRDFTFAQAESIARYLADLGVTDLYASPIFRARGGSSHGYDVVDSTAISEDLGGESEFEKLSATARRYELGFLLDVVPNHMAASPDNAWWTSVLENGPGSRFVNYFDIDWSPLDSGPERKVLLPILGRPYGEELEGGKLILRFDEGGFTINYYDRQFPVSTRSWPPILRMILQVLEQDAGMTTAALELTDLVERLPALAADHAAEPTVNSRFLKETLWRLSRSDATFDAAVQKALEQLNGRGGDRPSFDALDDVLELQWYRLAYWRIAGESINYRRFFDVADLVGVRVEEPEVFEARMSRVIQLVEQGKITGLRVDHIDGLFDPASHLRKLQARLGRGWTPDAKRLGFYVLVEKILAADETLPSDFACSGTTGYEFIARCDQLFIDPVGLDLLSKFYAETTGTDRDFESMVYQKKRLVIETLFYGEMRGLGNALWQLASKERNARDFSPSELHAALAEVTACLAVYRTYERDVSIAARDRDRIENAIAHARQRNEAMRQEEGSSLLACSVTPIDDRLFEFIRKVLLVEPPHYASDQADSWLRFVMRWQQFTGPVMAKGVEDTSFYNYNRLISMNEVGGEPGSSVVDAVETFHRHNLHVLESWPSTLNASSTHDTKRSEDSRARIHVLSEIPQRWAKHVRKWMRLNAPFRTSIGGQQIPDANEELLIYQSLVGVWPFDAGQREGLVGRMLQFAEKALREAKVHTSWLQQNAGYESAVKRFIEGILSAENTEFLEDFHRFASFTSFHGATNSISALLLKCVAPGVPDFYQGSELWDFSLVDPDNRRPVDYALRTEILDRHRSETGKPQVNALLRNWQNGEIKLFVTSRTLAIRNAMPSVFRYGSYEPLLSSGSCGESVVSLIRRTDHQAVLAVVPRLVTRLSRPGRFPIGAEIWKDTFITLPTAAPREWTNAFTGETVSVRESGQVPLASLLRTFPLALLIARDGSSD